MASSKLMTSSAPRNPDLRRRSSTSSSTKSSSITETRSNYDRNHNQTTAAITTTTTMMVDGNLRNLHGGDSQVSDSTLLDAEITLLDAAGAVTAISDNEQIGGAAGNGGGKTVDEVWKDIVEGRRERRRCKQEVVDDNEMMTLEDFLAKAGVVEEEMEDVKVALPPPLAESLSGGIYAFDQKFASGEAVLGFGSGNWGEAEGGRRKRRAVLEPMDKAAQQRQRRMIKNRESAARSRERKQAYQVELESLAVKLEEENERLLKEKVRLTLIHFLSEFCSVLCFEG
ncbi:hypothetical protein RJ639_042238 [Escallonia herrerae]|uniref:BZIP domain-containing protein n=1 Tax=Escallonia herrerae TaxID=1293975 RepID=A0AA89B660_9ASTE|nr:hypothetical protein RJ639_042238 [Escallonia herrerae]